MTKTAQLTERLAEQGIFDLYSARLKSYYLYNVGKQQATMLKFNFRPASLDQTKLVKNGQSATWKQAEIMKHYGVK